MNNREKFRKLLQRDDIIVAPGAPDAMTARIVQIAGFDVCYMGGNAVVASTLGFPDIGLASFSEMIERARSISGCIDIPLFCDADAGYGNVNNVIRTVQAFESAGVAGIHIEDQVTPKKCGAMADIKLLPIDESANKIRAAAQAKIDPDFVILARTDARAASGMDEAIRRIKAFEEAGADMVYVEMLRSREEIKSVVQSVQVPVAFDYLESADSCTPTVQELRNFGVKMVFYPMSAILYMAEVLKTFMTDLKNNGSSLKYHQHMMTLRNYEKLLGMEEQLHYQHRFGG